MQGQEDHPSHGADAPPPSLSKPRLISHKPRTQVLQCDYTDESGQACTCIVKLFSPRAKVGFGRERDVYWLGNVQKGNITASALWSGLWTSTQYQSFLGGNLPSMLRRTEHQVRVLVLSSISNSTLLRNVGLSSRLAAVKASLQSLRALHDVGIVHGDPSADNVLIQMCGDRLTATWIDFSASVIKPSEFDVSHELQKATEYFAQFVQTFSDSG